MEQKKPEKTPVSIALEALEQKLRELDEEYKRERAELENAIAMVKKFPAMKSGGNQNHAAAAGIQAGSWEGMTMPDAVHAFLSTYHKPVPFKVLLTGLEELGVRLGDPTKPRRYQANLKTTVMNNRKRFRYNRNRDTVVLLRPAV